MEKRVFLVEDLPRLRALLSDLVTSLGGFVIVGTATTEAEAIAWLAENDGGWDVGIIDLVLEQGSGLGVLKRAAAARNAPKIVVFTSYASPGIEEHCRRVGAHAIFEKSDTAGFITWLAVQNPSSELTD